MKPLNIYIGYDSMEIVAFHVLQHSILKKCSFPVNIMALKLDVISKIFSRKRDPNQSTEFAFSRFLVPYLNNYEGTAIFMDCDMLMRGDIYRVLESHQSNSAVSVVKHDYSPSATTKFHNNIQTVYEKKNWSSFMVFNCNNCHALTPEYVSSASGLELHQFKWLESDNLIGSLPIEWNYLVGEYKFKCDPLNVHFTLGGPWWKKFSTVQFSDEWKSTYKEMISSRE